MTETSERLLITDITVENFKSYYGVRKIGPFHQVRGGFVGVFVVVCSTLKEGGYPHVLRIRRVIEVAGPNGRTLQTARNDW